METLLWLEATALSIWLRESGPAFFGSLTLHALGMAFLVGSHVATDLRTLGVAPGVPLSLMRRFRPVAWLAMVVVTASGVSLLLAYPTKALTNPVFYLKLLLIAVATMLLMQIGRRAAGGAGAVGVGHSAPSRTMRYMAIASLVCWAGAITAGRLLAYTHSRLTATE
jgi:uncharacterized membrane protein